MLDKHRKWAVLTLFAGGVWTWCGPAPDYDKALRITAPALRAAKRQGSPLSWLRPGGQRRGGKLPHRPAGMQMYAEFAYAGEDCGMERLEERYRTCCGGEMGPILGLSRFNTVPGMRSTATSPVNACKIPCCTRTHGPALCQGHGGLRYGGPLCRLAEEYTAIAESGGRVRGSWASTPGWPGCWRASAGGMRHRRRRGPEDRKAPESWRRPCKRWRRRRLPGAGVAGAGKRPTSPTGSRSRRRLGGAARLESARTRVSAWAAGDDSEGWRSCGRRRVPFISGRAAC